MGVSSNEKEKKEIGKKSKKNSPRHTTETFINKLKFRSISFYALFSTI